MKVKGGFVLRMKLEQKETFPLAWRLKSATCVQLDERFQEMDGPHGMFPERVAEISLMFVLSIHAVHTWSLEKIDIISLHIKYY